MWSPTRDLFEKVEEEFDSQNLVGLCWFQFAAFEKVTFQ